MLEASGTLLGLSSGPLGALLGLPWALLGPSWSPRGALLGLSWAILEAIEQQRREHLFQSPPRGPTTRLLGPSWGLLGALLGALGAVLGRSWAPLGAVLGHLGAILRLQEPIGSEKTRMQTTLGVPVVEGFWPLQGFLGRLLGLLKPS
eukprot:9476901-Pyramimonas_sp.AAC.2